jgi:hypothetical protein
MIRYQLRFNNVSDFWFSDRGQIMPGSIVFFIHSLFNLNVCAKTVTTKVRICTNLHSTDKYEPTFLMYSGASHSVNSAWLSTR